MVNCRIIYLNFQYTCNDNVSASVSHLTLKLMFELSLMFAIHLLTFRILCTDVVNVFMRYCFCEERFHYFVYLYETGRTVFVQIRPCARVGQRVTQSYAIAIFA
jgi:hypothetical protein